MDLFTILMAAKRSPPQPFSLKHEHDFLIIFHVDLCLNTVRGFACLCVLQFVAVALSYSNWKFYFATYLRKIWGISSFWQMEWSSVRFPQRLSALLRQFWGMHSFIGVLLAQTLVTGCMTPPAQWESVLLTVTQKASENRRLTQPSLK